MPVVYIQFHLGKMAPSIVVTTYTITYIMYHTGYTYIGFLHVFLKYFTPGPVIHNHNYYMKKTDHKKEQRRLKTSQMHLDM